MKTHTNKETQNSNYRIRKLLGVLGILLPILLPLFGWEILSSISHYYYLDVPSLIFIIIFSSLALFLISYKGYKTDKGDRFSDDIITSLAGLTALLVIFIPTSADGSCSEIIDSICTCNLPLLGHRTDYIGYIHFLFAGIFLFCIGYMSLFRFTRGKKDFRTLIFKICGYTVWFCILILLILSVIKKYIEGNWFMDYYVIIFEVIAIWAFGIAWLLKGKTIEYVKSFRIFN